MTKAVSPGFNDLSPTKNLLFDGLAGGVNARRFANR
jgi:hypothetical protein